MDVEYYIRATKSVDKGVLQVHLFLTFLCSYSSVQFSLSYYSYSSSFTRSLPPLLSLPRSLPFLYTPSIVPFVHPSIPSILHPRSLTIIKHVSWSLCGDLTQLASLLSCLASPPSSPSTGISSSFYVFSKRHSLQ